jgi:hypothetical protein
MFRIPVSIQLARAAVAGAWLRTDCGGPTNCPSETERALAWLLTGIRQLTQPNFSVESNIHRSNSPIVSRPSARSPLHLPRPPRPPTGRVCPVHRRPRVKFQKPHRHPVTMPATTTILSRVGSQLTSRSSIALKGSLATSSRRTPALAALARYYASKCEQPPP